MPEMSIVENLKFTMRVCEMFYNENLTQKEIAASLNISRPQVCRILAYARERGLVSVHLNYPDTEESFFEHKIRELYGLTEVYVYDIGSDDLPNSLELLAQKSVGLFDACIRDNSRVGVMAGRSILEFAKALPRCKNRGLEFVPLSGGNAASGCEWFANSNAQLFASKTGGKHYVLNAPAYLSSVEVKNILENEESIREVTEKWGTCQTAIIGIGTVNVSSSAGRAGDLSEKDIDLLISDGASVSICCSYLNKSGKEIHNAVTEKFIGASISQLKNTCSIAIAIGAEKVPAICSALMGDCIDVLITSLETARLIVNEN